MIAVAWIWPALRKPKFWFAIALTTVVATTIWLSLDLREYMTAGGNAEKKHVKVIHTLVSNTDLPVVQIFLGSLIAGTFCLFFRKPKKKLAEDTSESMVEELG